jgi:hypothetical protein
MQTPQREIPARYVPQMQASRNKGEAPNISCPVNLVAIVERSDSKGSPEGLHFKEAWLNWDTPPLLRFLNKDAVVFKTDNVSTPNEAEAE